METFAETRTLAQDDFNRFAALSGDRNPIHVDPDFASRTHFGGTVSHGMLLYGLIMAALGRFLPGAVQREQFLMFPTGTRAGETVRVQLEVVQRDERSARITTLVLRPNGESGAEGEMEVDLPPGSSHE